MSADVWIVRDRCNACGRGGDTDESLNITYNLTGMLTAAGFHGWKWCIGKTAREVGTHMLAVLDGMNTDPAKWRAMNPPSVCWCDLCDSAGLWSAEDYACGCDVPLPWDAGAPRPGWCYCPPPERRVVRGGPR